jgi:hypothetical protein
MEKTLLTLFYIASFILVLSFLNNRDNFESDDTIREIVEQNIEDSNSKITIENVVVDSGIESYKKLEDRRHAMLLEQIRRLSVTNSHILEQQNNLATPTTASTGSAVEVVYNNTSYSISGSGSNTLDLNSLIDINSGETALVSLTIFQTGTDSSISGGYMGKYVTSLMKTDYLYSIEHEINNSSVFKATLSTETGVVSVNNLTGSAISLTVILKKLELV